MKNKITAMSAEQNREPKLVLRGLATCEGDIQFEVVLTDPSYSDEDVAEKLLSGEIYTFYGDTVLYDENRDKPIGTIEWGYTRPDFVPYTVDCGESEL